jgi:hypothetical protein
LWKAAARFLLTAQEADGPEADLPGPDGKPSGEKARARGFGVLPGDPAELELTLDVLSALLLVREHAKLTGKLEKNVETALRDGFAWLGLHFTGYSNFRLLVCAKRLGMLSKRRFLGTLDWKAEGLKFIGFQEASRGYLVADAPRRVAFTLYFLSPRFLY